MANPFPARILARLPYKMLVASHAGNRWHIYKKVKPTSPDLHKQQGDSLCGRHGVYLRKAVKWQDTFIPSEKFCQNCLRAAYPDADFSGKSPAVG